MAPGAVTISGQRNLVLGAAVDVIEDQDEGTRLVVPIPGEHHGTHIQSDAERRSQICAGRPAAAPIRSR